MSRCLSQPETTENVDDNNFNNCCILNIKKLAFKKGFSDRQTLSSDTINENNLKKNLGIISYSLDSNHGLWYHYIFFVSVMMWSKVRFKILRTKF